MALKNHRYLEALKAEKEAIVEAVAAANHPICELVILDEESERKADLQSIYDLFNEEGHRIIGFHFAGHADGYQLILQEEKKEGTKIADAGGLIAFFKQKRKLKFIFLNGCETFQQAKEIHEQGIPSVIGSRHPIDDELAQIFAAQFYRSLAQGMALEHAWNDASSKVQTQKGNYQVNAANRSLIFTSENAGEAEALRLDWELFTTSPEWNLGGEAGNPTFGLPEPLIEKRPGDQSEVEEPFRYLKPYDEYTPHLFFGRGYEIRELLSLLVSADNPLILFYGQSGVGKSSVLHAGVFPRVKSRQTELNNQIIYLRRDPKQGLLKSLREHLLVNCQSLPKNEPQSLRSLIEQILSENQPSDQSVSHNPFDQVPQLVILIDQVEEAYTRPLSKGKSGIRDEWEAFLAEMTPILLNPSI